MIVTVFRSRLRLESQHEYKAWDKKIEALAVTMPGYIAHKFFTAADGERVTLVEFASDAAVRAWGAHPEHREAQRQGRDRFYSEYCIQVCEVLRETRFPPRETEGS